MSVNKYDYLLKIEENCMKDALIIIDVQNVKGKSNERIRD